MSGNYRMLFPTCKEALDRFLIVFKPQSDEIFELFPHFWSHAKVDYRIGNGEESEINRLKLSTMKIFLNPGIA